MDKKTVERKLLERINKTKCPSCGENLRKTILYVTKNTITRYHSMSLNITGKDFELEELHNEELETEESSREHIVICRACWNEFTATHENIISFLMGNDFKGRQIK